MGWPQSQPRPGPVRPAANGREDAAQPLEGGGQGGGAAARDPLEAQGGEGARVMQTRSGAALQTPARRAPRGAWESVHKGAPGRKPAYRIGGT